MLDRNQVQSRGDGHSKRPKSNIDDIFSKKENLGKTGPTELPNIID